MGPTRRRDLAVAAVVAAVLGYVGGPLGCIAGSRRSRCGRGCPCSSWRRSRGRLGVLRPLQDRRREDRRRPGPAASARGRACRDDRQGVGLGGRAGPRLVGWASSPICCPGASETQVAGEDTAGRRGGRGECAGAGDRRAVAAALLQVAGRPAGGRRRCAGVARREQLTRTNRRSGRHAMRRVTGTVGP